MKEKNITLQSFRDTVCANSFRDSANIFFPPVTSYTLKVDPSKTRFSKSERLGLEV